MPRLLGQPVTDGVADAITRAVLAGFGAPVAPATPRERSCRRCNAPLAPDAALGKTAAQHNACQRCRDKYKGWDKLTMAERAARATGHIQAPKTGRVSFVRYSANKKTGPIPVTVSEPSTCPPTCTFYDAGCYALYGRAALAWRTVHKHGIPWDELLLRINALRPGQLWRHNIAGDLRGDGERIDARALMQLAEANTGKAGFTYTHKPVVGTAVARSNRAAIAAANKAGFTVNLSADSEVQADAYLALGIAPVVLVVPTNAPRRMETVYGNTVVVCPAQDGTETCMTCGLCAKSDRKAIIGFRAHGNFDKLVSELVVSKRKVTHGQDKRPEGRAQVA